MYGVCGGWGIGPMMENQTEKNSEHDNGYYRVMFLVLCFVGKGSRVWCWGATAFCGCRAGDLGTKGLGFRRRSWGFGL